MKKLITTETGGFPFVSDDLRFVQAANIEAFKGLASSFVDVNDSDDYLILSGLLKSGNNITPGFVFINGEVCYCHGMQNAPSSVKIGIENTFDPSGSKMFLSNPANPIETYQITEAVIYDAINAPGQSIELITGSSYTNQPKSLRNKIALVSQSVFDSSFALAWLTSYNTNFEATRYAHIDDMWAHSIQAFGQAANVRVLSVKECRLIEVVADSLNVIYQNWQLHSFVKEAAATPLGMKINLFIDGSVSAIEVVVNSTSVASSERILMSSVGTDDYVYSLHPNTLSEFVKTTKGWLLLEN